MRLGGNENVDDGTADGDLTARLHEGDDLVPQINERVREHVRVNNRTDVDDHGFHFGNPTDHGLQESADRHHQHLGHVSTGYSPHGVR